MVLSTTCYFGTLKTGDTKQRHNLPDIGGVFEEGKAIELF